MVVKTYFVTEKKMLIKEEDLKSFEELKQEFYDDYFGSKLTQDIFNIIKKLTKKRRKTLSTS